MSTKKHFLKTKPLCKVTFLLPKAATMACEKVVLVGDFNEWDLARGIEMKATKLGFSTTLELEAGQNYQYKYLIDNVRWENDWEADAYVASPFGGDNSVVHVPMQNLPNNLGKGDDLRKIEGVGPKIASLLQEAGIQSFKDLAKTKQQTLKEVLADAGKIFQMHDPTSWPKQAELAANGKWEALDKLKNELNNVMIENMS